MLYNMINDEEYLRVAVEVKKKKFEEKRFKRKKKKYDL